MEALMETLRAQQELLQRLYTELDVEREAAASAASESLAMILRLQGERAAVEMEASQYKRIAEEKIVHTEETLEIFRDVIYQKEMRISSLEFQLHAYKNCTPIDGEVSGESSVMVLPEMQDEVIGHAKNGDFSSYWEQIRQLDEQVKQLSDSKDCSDGGNKPNEMSRSCSSHSFEACEHPVTPSKVHDIFEVPEIGNDGEFADLNDSKEKGKLSPEYGIIPVTPVKTVISEDKRMTMSPDIDNAFPKQREGLDAEHLYNKRPEVAEFELRQMDRRLKRLERPKQETALGKGDDELLLLNAIKDQLNSLEDEIQQLKPKKPLPTKKFDLNFLAEGLLRCWL